MVARVEDLRKSYRTGTGEVVALDDVSLAVSAGEFLVVMGASGSGKSTLLHLLGGLDTPTSGRVFVDEHDLAAMSDRDRTLFRRRQIGIVFQAYNLLPTLDALENVALPAMLDGVDPQDARRRAKDLLEQAGLGRRMTHRPQALSGGEQQRVAIVRALVNQPAILLADEPTGNLDSDRGQAIWEWLGRLVRNDGRTVVAVTHEPEGAAHADRVAVLRDGQLRGVIHPTGDDRATLVATRYRELVA